MITCCDTNTRRPSVYLSGGAYNVCVFSPFALTEYRRAVMRLGEYFTAGHRWALELGSFIVDTDWWTRTAPSEGVCHHLNYAGYGSENDSDEIRFGLGWSLIRALAKAEVIVTEPTRAYKRGRIRLRKRAMQDYVDERTIALWAAGE